MEEIIVTGGARVGWVNATWPLAKLFASATRLRLRSVFDTYEFLPGDVIALERYGLIPFFASGIRITHARSDYPPKIIFWYLGNPETLLEKIRGVGFLPTAPISSEIKGRGFPVRLIAVLVLILAWNGLFILGDSFGHRLNARPGFFALVPLSIAFLVCWRTKTSPGLQKLILREGHSVGEIKSILSLIQTVCAILLVIFGILVLANAFG